MYIPVSAGLGGIALLRATGKQGERIVKLGILPDGETACLFFRTENDLWDLSGRFASVQGCIAAAHERYGVSPGTWNEGETAVSDMMEAYAMDALTEAREFHGIVLDLSEESLWHLERMLSEFYAKRPQGLFRLFRPDLPAVEVEQLVRMMGAYLGETIRRQFGGEWTAVEAEGAGRQLVGLRLGDRVVFPAEQVRRRLTVGPAESVMLYFRRVREEHLRALVR